MAVMNQPFGIPFGLREETMLSVVAPEVIENFKSAARRLTGYRRRQFQAEIALQYCDGSARKAEQVFGWYRRTVETGIRELQTGIRCVDNFAARGRKKAEVKTPALKAAIEELAEPHSQADPKFQTPLAFTRITARAVREELLKRPELAGAVPSRQVVGEILNGLGYRLRRVRKTLPEKKFPKPTPSSTTSPGGGKPREATHPR